MVLNEYIVIYSIFSVCSLVAISVGAGVGLFTVMNWRKDTTPEKRYQLEKNLYLCSSALFTGVSARVVMIPVWFLLLQSLIPMIPGAMCLAGVHQAVPNYSWEASALKLILPLVYFAWIVMTVIDRKLIEQPFLRFRSYFLILLILLIFREIYTDASYLLSLKPIKVSCCTAMFDFDTARIPQIFTQSHWYWVIAFCTLLGLQTLFVLSQRDKKIAYIVITLTSALLFPSLILSLHTRLSPLILDAPFHHCIFCLLQVNGYVLAGTSLLMLGIYLSFSYGLVGILSTGRGYFPKVKPYLSKIKFTFMVLYAAGFILILFPTMHSLKNAA